jgi:hypothetical protein
VALFGTNPNLNLVLMSTKSKRKKGEKEKREVKIPRAKDLNKGDAVSFEVKSNTLGIVWSWNKLSPTPKEKG